MNLIAILIVIYLVFRICTSYVFPKISHWRLNRFKEKFKEDNPHIFKDKTDL